MKGVLQDGPVMVDGIVDIPLQGRTIDPAAGKIDSAATCHYFIGPENRLVEIAVRSVLSDLPKNYNPLVLYGPSGTGKSHIARGIATEWNSRDRRRRAVCTTAVDFGRELADAIETQAVDEFRAKYRKASLLVFEDLGLLVSGNSGKLSAQEELVHTLDALVSHGSWVIVTASSAPGELPAILPALRSRLTAGLTVPLVPPGPDARAAILQQLAEFRKVDLPASIVRTLADAIPGTAPDLAGALTQLEVPVRLDGGQIDDEMVEEYLGGRNGKRAPTLHDIALATARHFSLKLSDLRSPVRRRSLVTARGVAVYLARHLTKESLEQIGGYFGGRDHTTVMHSCRKTETLLETDPAVREAVQQLRERLWKK